MGLSNACWQLYLLSSFVHIKFPFSGLSGNILILRRVEFQGLKELLIKCLKNQNKVFRFLLISPTVTVMLSLNFFCSDTDLLGERLKGKKVKQTKSKFLLQSAAVAVLGWPVVNTWVNLWLTPLSVCCRDNTFGEKELNSNLDSKYWHQWYNVKMLVSMVSIFWV